MYSTQGASAMQSIQVTPMKRRATHTYFTKHDLLHNKQIMINCCTKHGLLQVMVVLYQIWSLTGHSGVVPDMVSYRSWCCCTRYGLLQVMVGLYQIWSLTGHGGVVPDIVSYRSWCGCTRYGLLQVMVGLYQIWILTCQRGVVPNMVSYMAMFDCVILKTCVQNK